MAQRREESIPRTDLSRFLLLKLILIHIHPSCLCLSPGSGVSPLALDTKLNRLMANPVGSLKLFMGKEILPSLGDQKKHVRTIDGYLTVEHRKLQLTPHDV